MNGGPTHQCGQCGALVADRGKHGQWHEEMARTLASLADTQRVLAEAHRVAACHASGDGRPARELARA